MSEEELKATLSRLKSKGMSESHTRSLYNAFLGDVDEPGHQRGISTREFDKRMKKLEAHPSRYGVEQRHVQKFRKAAEPELDEGVKRG